jgi:hypothetical protein
MSSSSGPSSWLRTLATGGARQTNSSTQAGLELTLQRLTVDQVDSSAESGLDIPQHTPPLLIPSKGHAAQLASSGSAGLPSALATPPAKPVVGQQVTTVLSSSGQQEQQQVSQQPGSGGSSAKGLKGVRWLPGLQAAPESSSYPPYEQAAAAAAATVQPRNGNTSGRDDGDGGSSNQQQPQGSHTTNRPASASSSSSSSRTVPLPASDDPQLDKYLRYLLQEQHPHKFMYYEAYGMTVDGELSSAATSGLMPAHMQQSHQGKASPL